MTIAGIFRASRIVGFSLLEVLVATAVLFLVLALALSAISLSSLSFRHSNQTMGAVGQARFVLDALGNDLSQRVRREELPFVIVAQPGNDAIRFYSAVPSALPSGNDARGIALVAYRSNPNTFRLERAAVGTSWSPSNVPLVFTDSMVPQTIPAPSDQDFDTASESVFRIEFSILDKDGDILAVSPSIPRDFHRNVAGIVVTVATLDPDARTRLTNADIEMARLSSAFPDAVPGELPANQWIQRLNDITALSGETGLPVAVLSGVRVSQRILYVQ